MEWFAKVAFGGRHLDKRAQEVTDGRLASVAESAASRSAAVTAMPVLRTRCGEVADGRSASAAKSKADRLAASSAMKEERVPSVVPRVVHQLSGFDPQEWLLLGSDGVVVAEQTSLLGLVTAGAAKAKVVTAGSLAWISQALGLLEDVGAAHACSY